MKKFTKRNLEPYPDQAAKNVNYRNYRRWDPICYKILGYTLDMILKQEIELSRISFDSWQIIADTIH